MSRRRSNFVPKTYEHFHPDSLETQPEKERNIMGSISKLNRRALMKCGLASAALPVVSKLVGSPAAAEAQAKSDPSFAAIPGQVGGQDIFGAYDVAPNWPKPLSSLPGNEKWT